MTLEDALAQNDKMLYCLISWWLLHVHGSYPLSDEFDRLVGLSNDNPVWGLLNSKFEHLSPKALCEQALALGYVEEAMRAAAALRSLELREGVTLYI